MITKDQIPSVLGHTAYDRSHRRLGRIGQVYLDEVTGEPQWLTVRTGLFGTKETLVPLEPAELQGDEVVLPFRQEDIKNAPTVEAEGGQLPPEQEARLYDYYGMQYQPYTAPEAGMPEADMAEAGMPETAAESDTDEAMTRAEEHLVVGKEDRRVGRARLRKYVVTEYEQHTVPVRREEVRVVREPITEENVDQALAGPEISEAEHEVVLHEERPVVGKETVPKERVRIEKEDVIEQETVGGEVRKEQIQSELDSEDLTDEERPH